MLRRKLLTTVVALLVTSGLSFSATSAESRTLMPGVEYKKIPTPHVIAPYTKTVVEVFGYSCPHCYHLEPSLNHWLKDKPADVHFERMPVVFNNPNWIFMAKVFYTAQELGVLEQSHEAFFNALHRDKKELYTVEKIAEFFTQFGVKEADFIGTFKGFKVDQLVRKAQQLTRSYGIEGVPSIVVNGKYLTDVPMTGSRDKLWKTVDTLTDQ
ncbi:thiol:disulfide interchange protein DsbA/DsbL [Thiomicrorhabdus arctica]|uniref:thiol:disulfide interchange protein DsbA/DsbL n=1 Tax=Thiomicrorhabdus arctica TaxID=131540 RepID=UPI00036441A7|nr:thiol:disulfide interchange protein DsbA/DsbL [Thiomicrorhabdus arctica]